MVIIVRAKNMGKTAKKLYLRLNKLGIRTKLIKDNPLLISWGKKIQFGLNDKAIYNKYLQLKKVNKAGILTPKIYDNFDEIDKFPVVGRNYHHFGAKDFVFIKSPSEYVKRDYYLKYIRKIGEYRIHYCLGNFYVCKKVKKDDNANLIIRNHKNGWKFVTYERVYKNDLIEFAKRVVSALNYNFGAIDCIMDKNHRLYFLEMNSAPGLDNKRLDFYVNCLKRRLK